MHYVGQHLIIGIRMNSSHQAIEHADLVVQRFNQWREAVGGTRRIRYHGIRCLQHTLIHAIDDGGVHIFATGSGNDDFLCTAFQVGRGFFFGGKKARTLEHNINAQLAPGDISRITLREYTDLVAIHDHVVALDQDRAGEFAVRGVIARQVRVGFGIAEIVDRNDLDIILFAALVMSAQHIAADAAVAIDGNFDGHEDLPERCDVNWYRVKSVQNRLDCGYDFLCREAEMLEQHTGRRGLTERIDAYHRAIKTDILEPDIGDSCLDRHPWKPIVQHAGFVCRVLPIEYIGTGHGYHAHRDAFGSQHIGGLQRKLDL